MYVKFLVIFQGERFYELACLVAVRKNRTDLKKYCQNKFPLESINVLKLVSSNISMILRLDCRKY